MQQGNLQLNHIVPTVVSDGHMIFINTEGDVPTLNFFQVRTQDGDHVHADVVASVRLTNLKDLTQLRDTIDQTITDHKNREV